MNIKGVVKMKFTTKVTGKVMEIKKTKKDEPYAVLYSDGNLLNIFKIGDTLTPHINKDVSLEVEVMTKEAYIIKK